MLPHDLPIKNTMYEYFLQYRNDGTSASGVTLYTIRSQAVPRPLWYPAPLEVDGVIYQTAEHWMMAGKARFFGDAEAFERIVLAPDPKSAKAVGRVIRGFDDKVWKAVCRQIVTEGNVRKFSQNE